jgi:hypothetical protein
VTLLNGPSARIYPPVAAPVYFYPPVTAVLYRPLAVYHEGAAETWASVGVHRCCPQRKGSDSAWAGARLRLEEVDWGKPAKRWGPAARWSWSAHCPPVHLGCLKQLLTVTAPAGSARHIRSHLQQCTASRQPMPQLPAPGCLAALPYTFPTQRKFCLRTYTKVRPRVQCPQLGKSARKRSARSPSTAALIRNDGPITRWCGQRIDESGSPTS